MPFPNMSLTRSLNLTEYFAEPVLLFNTLDISSADDMNIFADWLLLVVPVGLKLSTFALNVAKYVVDVMFFLNSSKVVVT